MKKNNSSWDLVLATFDFYKKRYKDFFGIYAIALVGAFPLVIISVVYRLVNLNNDGDSFVWLNIALAVLYFLATLVAAYFSLSAQISCFLIVKGSTLKNSWQLFWSARKYMGHYLMVWLIFATVVLLSAIPLMLSLNSYGYGLVGLSRALGTMGLLGWWYGIFLMIFAIPIVYVVINYGLAFFAYMEHGFENVRALARSRELIKGRFFEVLKSLLPLVITWSLSYLIILLPLTLLRSDNWLYVIVSIVLTLLLIMINFVFVPSVVIYGNLLYQKLLKDRVKSKVKNQGHPVITVTMIVLAVLFLSFALLNTLNKMSTANLAYNKMVARDWRRIQDINLIQSGLAEYYRDQGKFPEWLVMGESLMTDDQIYLTLLPRNPKYADGTCGAEFEYSYQPTAGGHDYILNYCLGTDLTNNNANVLLKAGMHSVGNNDLLF